jgi:magnesium chelatase family protein
MLAKTLAYAVVGREGALVEVDIGPSLPNFTIVGLPDAAVQEGKARIRAAVKNSGCVFAQRRITVNLAPPACRRCLVALLYRRSTYIDVVRIST